ncbi:hypothetical protein U0C82_09020 [Fulvimarina sp. 2208YS6-2-32]|uniref:ABC transmembrane type-1 domain-containing protein n=1 Tax=Fulvimarina uroteuthidis TaxID=3098149 RepID=A0ABU5I1Q8_9HYPH|nr:hypothetical protein [Fulvimarina sp. 2208YS6-2-32]MDY8109282.1 hypothetical protein [Fulvimarina sp. 2208YS6-2-32]
MPGERLALAGLACFVFCLSLVPVLRLAWEAVAPGGVPNLTLAWDVLTAPATLTATWHSLVTAFFGTILSLILGTALALLVALTDMGRKAIIVFLFLLPLMIPPQVTALAWAQLFGPSSPLLVTLGLAPPIGSPNPIYSPEGIILLLGPAAPVRCAPCSESRCPSSCPPSSPAGRWPSFRRSAISVFRR